MPRTRYTLASVMLLTAVTAVLLAGLAPGMHNGAISAGPVILGAVFGSIVGVIAGIQLMRPLVGSFVGFFLGVLVGGATTAILAVPQSLPTILGGAAVILMMGGTIRYFSDRTAANK